MISCRTLVRFGCMSNSYSIFDLETPFFAIQELKKQSFLLGLWLIAIEDGTLDLLEICLPWSLFFKWKFGVRIIGVKGLIRLGSSTTTSSNSSDVCKEKKVRCIISTLFSWLELTNVLQYYQQKQLRDLDSTLFVATQTWKDKVWWEIIKYIGVRIITKVASIFFLCVQE